MSENATPAPEPTGAPVGDTAAQFSAPLGSQIPEAPQSEAPAEKAIPTAHDAVQKAFEKAEKGERTSPPVKETPIKAADQPPQQAKPPVQPVQQAQPQTEEKPPVAQESKYREPPTRFKGEALKVWEATPEPVREEAHRAVRELESGLKQYQERYEAIKPYEDAIQRNGTTLKEVLDRVSGIEQEFERGPIEGMQAVARHFGLDIREMAAHILNQPVDQVRSQDQQVISELQREIATMKQQLGGVTETFQRQTTAQFEDLVGSFASDKPDFEELGADIEFFLSSAKVPADLPPQEKLELAYKLARALNGRTDPLIPAAQTSGEAPSTPLIPAGRKSVSGAPATGSNPRKPNAARNPSQIPNVADTVKAAAARFM